MWFTEKVSNLDDYQGKKIRGFGSQNALVDALGGASVSLPHSESFMALQLGTIDGYITSPGKYMELKHYEICKYFVRTPMLAITNNDIEINLDVWNELPDDIKAILEVAGAEHSIRYARAQYMLNQEFFSRGSELYGTNFIDFSQEDIAKMTQAAVPVWDEFSSQSPGAAEMVRILKEHFRALGILE